MHDEAAAGDVVTGRDHEFRMLARDMRGRGLSADAQHEKQQREGEPGCSAYVFHKADVNDPLFGYRSVLSDFTQPPGSVQRPVHGCWVTRGS
ncbi:hypothetical protein GCM10010207_64340 [Streptomyces atratus]|nr:hypothetical protein GCM10010207_64340 [Streptomyces atratus]